MRDRADTSVTRARNANGLLAAGYWPEAFSGASCGIRALASTQLLGAGCRVNARVRCVTRTGVPISQNRVRNTSHKVVRVQTDSRLTTVRFGMLSALHSET